MSVSVVDSYGSEWWVLEGDGQWFCHLIEYPEEGSIGPFLTRSDAVAYLDDEVGPVKEIEG